MLKSLHTFLKSIWEKVYFQVPDTGTRVLDNTKPFWFSSIVCFWMPPALSKEHKYHIFGQYWYTRNVPVFTNTGTFQYLGPEVYFFQYLYHMLVKCEQLNRMVRITQNFRLFDNNNNNKNVDFSKPFLIKRKTSF